jgi:endonuclease I
MKRITFLFIVVSHLYTAQIPTGYYNSAQGLTGSSLKVALHNIVKNHTVLAYNNLWTAFQNTDKKTNGKVWDIYSYVPSGTQPYEYTFITNQCGSYNSEGDCYNREHTWPQSWFNSDVTPTSDLFHVYPTDGSVNGIRANYPYGNVGNTSNTTQNGSKLGTCSNAGYNLTVFEPIDEFKGDLARSYFYMSTRYYNEDGSWAITDATNRSNILQWQVNVLLQWHHQDPVSTKETARNNAIYSLQNNRNPYIDYPQWADSVWAAGVIGLKEFSYSKPEFTIYPNPSNDYFTIKSQTNTLPNTLKVFNMFGELIETISASEDTKINCSNWSSGVYFISINETKGNNYLKFVKQ